MNTVRHKTITRLNGALLALLFASPLIGCDCDPENVGELRCEYTVDPHDDGNNPQPVDFGSLEVGESRTRTVAIHNTGTVPLNDLKFDFSGHNGEQFQLGSAIPDLNVGSQVSIPILFAPQIAATEMNHTVLIKHKSVQNLPCPAFSVSLRGGSFEIPDRDAGVDGGGDAGGNDVLLEDAGTDGGSVVTFPDASRPFDGGGAYFAVAALQDPRSHFAAAPVEDGGILVGGGYGPSGSVLDSIEKLNPKSGKSQIVSRFGDTQGRAQLTATRMDDGRVAFIGGLLPGAEDLAMPAGDIWVYTPSSGSLLATSYPLGTPRFGHIAVAVGEAEILVAFGQTRTAVSEPLQLVGDATRVFLDGTPNASVELAGGGPVDPRAETTASKLVDGRVVVVGGRDTAGSALASILVYQNQELVPISATLQVARYGHSAVLLEDGRLLVLGGASDSGPAVTLEALDTTQPVEQWEFVVLRDDLEPRVGAMAARVAPQAVLLAGGISQPEVEAGQPQRARDDAALLLAVGDQLVLTSPSNGLAVPRWRGQMVVSGDLATIVGGSTTSQRRSPVPSIERFTLQSGAFDSPGFASTGGAPVLLSDGRFIVCGGVDLHTKVVSAKTRIYDPLTELTVDGPPLAVARRDFSATLIDHNLLLLVGGVDVSGVALRSTELYDLTSGTSTVAAFLLTPRSHHSATLLEDGRVLLCGGKNAGGDLLESCSLYDPGQRADDPEDDAVALVVGYMSAQRSGHQATLFGADKVLLSGGTDPARGVRYDDVFHGAADQLTQVSSLPSVARRRHVAVAVEPGWVLLAGGETYNGAYVASDSAELYDEASNAYLALPSLVTPRIGASALLFQGGYVLLSGGVRPTSGNFDRPSVALAASELFDPTAGVQGAFVAVDAPLRAPRGMGLGANVFGQPLVFFGESRDGRLASGVEQHSFHISMERFDPEAR